MKYKIGDKVLIFGDDLQPILKTINFIEINKSCIVYGFEEYDLRLEKDVYANVKEYEKALKEQFDDYLTEAKKLMKGTQK